jgi:hypothetical protein
MGKRMSPRWFADMDVVGRGLPPGFASGPARDTMPLLLEHGGFVLKPN